MYIQEIKDTQEHIEIDETEFYKGQTINGLGNENVIIKAFSKIDDIRNSWKSLTKDQSIFLSFEFLKAVEQSPPKGLSNRYLICTRNKRPLAILSCQLKGFSAQESIQFGNGSNPIQSFNQKIKKGFASLINFEGIVCGSVLLTGNYAFRFFQDDLSYKEEFILAEKIIEAYRKQLNREGERLKVSFLKDFYADKSFLNNNITESNYREFTVQPNMILGLRRQWSDMNGYLDAFSSKYRVRFRRARKKFHGVERREMDLESMIEYKERIYDLYANIVETVGFNLFLLNSSYFISLKKHLKSKFRMFGYFKKNNMLAFYTCIDNGEEMNAHFLGYDPEANKEHQLYLNSLYDMVEEGIRCQFKTINFSRTALEIKSSIGAEPKEMFCYLKHRNPTINTVVSKIVDVLNPTEEWVQRHPFKFQRE